MNKLFNSTLEVSMRLIILLSILNDSKNIDIITCLDFMATYSKDFQINNINLHGDNNYNLSGFTLRRSIIRKSLNTLVSYGLIDVQYTSKGIEYQVNIKSRVIVSKLNNIYASEYQQCVFDLLESVKNLSDNQIVKNCNIYIAQRIRRKNV